jgi:threonine synthase
MLTRPGVDLALSQDQALLLRIVLTFALAAASYRFVEAPILGRRLDRASPSPQFAAGVLAALSCVAVFFLAPAQRPVAGTAKALSGPSIASGRASTAGVAGTTVAPATEVAAAVNVAGVAGTTRPPPPLVRGYAGQLTVIGDSVALGARSALERGIDGAAVYATVGWQAADVLKILERIRFAEKTYGITVDTHTADGIKVARENLTPGVTMIVLETALPAKFNETIREALGRDADRPAGFENIEALPQRFEVMPADAARVKAFVAEHTGL